MSGAIRLYHTLHQALKQLGSFGRPENMKTLAMLMVGIFQSSDVRLSRIAAKTPLDFRQDSVAQRFRRWLKNPLVDERAIYDPVVRNLLVGLRHTRLRIQIDRTLLEDRFNVLMVSLYVRKRALPLVWQVLPHQGSSDYLDWVEILSHLADLLPEGAQVILLGDREFGTADLMSIADGYGWEYCLRVKGSNYVYLPQTGQWVELSQLIPQRGEHYFLTDVKFTKSNHYPSHLALAYDGDEPCFVATNRIPSLRTLREYARRFGCEPLFSDLKTRGFDLEQTRLIHADRLSRLLLALALLLVWVLSVARRVKVTGQAAQLLGAAHIDRYSLFQIGSRWLSKRLTLGCSLIPDADFRLWQFASR